MQFWCDKVFCSSCVHGRLGGDDMHAVTVVAGPATVMTRTCQPDSALLQISEALHVTSDVLFA